MCFFCQRTRHSWKYLETCLFQRCLPFMEHFYNSCFKVCQIIPATMLFQCWWLFIVPSKLRFSWFFICQVILNCILKYYETLLLLLSRFSVQLCVTPKMAAHQAPQSLGFSRQEHWSGLPFPSPMHESEKWKWTRSVVFDC